MVQQHISATKEGSTGTMTAERPSGMSETVRAPARGGVRAREEVVVDGGGASSLSRRRSTPGGRRRGGAAAREDSGGSMRFLDRLDLGILFCLTRRATGRLFGRLGL